MTTQCSIWVIEIGGDVDWETPAAVPTAQLLDNPQEQVPTDGQLRGGAHRALRRLGLSNERCNWGC